MTQFAVFLFGIRRLAVASVGLVLLVALGALPVRADIVTLTDGEVVDGIIQSISGGLVTIDVSGQTREINIRDVDNIDFNTPHLPELVESSDVVHFLGDADAQDMVGHAQELRDTADEIEQLLDRIRTEWSARNPVPLDQEAEWEAVKEEFRRPVSRYQEVLRDLYFHIVAHVDDYNRLMNEASDVYVGVEGVFRVGSSLVPRELRQLPLDSYMPRNWYDAIFYDGYYVGYDDAYQELGPELNPDN